MPETPDIIWPEVFGWSDHLRVSLTVKERLPPSTEAEVVFLPTPHRLKSPIRCQALEAYRRELPVLAEKLRERGSQEVVDETHERFQTAVQRPWKTKVRGKTLRFKCNWTKLMHSIARARTIDYQKAVRDGKARDLARVRKLSRLIKKLGRTQDHKLREATAQDLRNCENSLSPAEISAWLKTVERGTADADQRGEVMVPAEFTRSFADKQPPDKLVQMQKFVLPAEMEGRHLRAIRTAKKGKTARLDGLFIEILKLFPDEFANVLFALFHAGARLGRVVKG